METANTHSAHALALSKSNKPGKCTLCLVYTHSLERHHIKYKPEVTIDLCHNCHFLCHYFPNRLPKHHKFHLLTRVYAYAHAVRMLELYENNPVVLAKLFAPSRREAIHQAQREELERIKKEEKK